jgi:molybdenum cofactor cytidylyltransferase
VKSAFISVILLAAGGSTRLGQPKQLLRIGNRSLIRRLIEEALASRADEVLVVIGSQADEMRNELKGLTTKIVDNKGWANGLSSSVKAGLEAVSERCRGALFMLCDQPYVTSDLLNQLIKRFESTQASVVACEYAETVGIPALFSEALFFELKQLKGDAGAKSIILAHEAKIERIPFPRGVVDIDTTDDLDALPRS